MKTYSDYMYEISKEVLYEKLLSYGMFSEKIPPFLTSEVFSNLCISSNPGFENKSYNYIRYNSMRNTGFPRQIGIPTPFAYEKLCSTLKKYWDEIRNHFYNQTSKEAYVVSRLHIQLRNGINPLFEMNYDDWYNAGSPEDDLFLGAKYIVKSDISTCFPSIYTHAVPWALVGKEESKKSNNSRKWFNEIDKSCRNMKDKETHGILIGPHSSNVISEILLTTIDCHLYEKGYRYVRHIDDYTCYVENREKADSFIRDLIDELSYFDLSLNYKKTKVIELPAISDDYWRKELNEFDFVTSYEQVNYKMVQSYLELAIRLMKNYNNNAAILNYAIKTLSNHPLTENGKKLFGDMVMHYSIIYPYLVGILEKNVFEKINLEINKINKLSNILYIDGINKRNYEQSCYAIYFALKYNFSLDEISDSAIISSNNCILKLLAYLYFKKEKNNEALNKFHEHALYLCNQEMDRYWIYIYEVLDENELNGDWKEIKRKKISFVKPEFIFHN